MPNWCSTVFKFYGEITAIKDFRSKILKYTTKEFVRNNFGCESDIAWLGNIVKGFGFEVDGDNHLRCRGTLIDIYNEHDEGFNMVTETAWTPMLGMWHMIIDKFYSDEDGNNLIGFSWVAEEPGCQLYCTNNINDWEYDYFHVDACINDNYFSDYFSNEEDVLEYINEILSDEKLPTISSIEELKNYNCNDGEYCNVLELEEVDDDYFD